MTVALVANIALPISSALSIAFSTDAVGKMDAYGKIGASSPAWSPLSLFANDEEGVWFDPSDLSTMFQDSAGTTPVTADGQPVGLILDKSKGLALGANVCPSFTDANWNVWGALPSGWVMSGGVLTVTSAAQWSRASTTFPVNALNKWYKAAVDIASISGTLIVKPWRNWDTNYVFEHDFTTTGIKTVYFYSDNATAGLELQTRTSTFSCVINSCTVQELSGNHAFQATAAARPLKTSTGAADWINYDAVDDVLTSKFPSSLGSSCTVCRANVGAAPTILTAQTIGTSYDDSTDHAGLITINRALTGQETTDVTAWLLAKGAT